MRQLFRRGWSYAAVVLLASGLLAGCVSSTRVPAPVEDRNATARATAPVPPPVPAVVAEPVKPLPGAENAGRPGYYTVRPRDTLIRIALDSGQNWRDLVRWNNIEDPNVIEVGQVLRVSPPSLPTPAAEVAQARPTAP
ncbi:MAG TPA: LysM peptidoglycan-binding domain-containing protein, partial [Ramlibacter sp.]|nr:LysM peptidoglycan-binding domain-containing protein [Ramlibacter sp.]